MKAKDLIGLLLIAHAILNYTFGNGFDTMGTTIFNFILIVVGSIVLNYQREHREESEQ